MARWALSIQANLRHRNDQAARSLHTGSGQTICALLEVPFDPIVIEWRVTNTSKGKINGSLRGQVIPYADQRA